MGFLEVNIICSDRFLYTQFDLSSLENILGASFKITQDNEYSKGSKSFTVLAKKSQKFFILNKGRRTYR